MQPFNSTHMRGQTRTQTFLTTHPAVGNALVQVTIAASAHGRGSWKSLGWFPCTPTSSGQEVVVESSHQQPKWTRCRSRPGTAVLKPRQAYLASLPGRQDKTGEGLEPHVRKSSSATHQYNNRTRQHSHNTSHATQQSAFSPLLVGGAAAGGVHQIDALSQSPQRAGQSVHRRPVEAHTARVCSTKTRKGISVMA